MKKQTLNVLLCTVLMAMVFAGCKKTNHTSEDDNYPVKQKHTITVDDAIKIAKQHTHFSGYEKIGRAMSLSKGQRTLIKQKTISATLSINPIKNTPSYH